MITMSNVAGRRALRGFPEQLTRGADIGKHRSIEPERIMSAPVTASHGRYAADPVCG
ncbi:hypothetical protein [Jidongwangia harbinensis]|uniref:hypothetical protein n=1 Tax=Jidongwangia harbinensis TaxID=2878561 RepID=UPI001CD9DAF2|nr:hypothetical protein [Jidongwangia harbinensis]